MTIEEAVNELDELTMYVEHVFTEEHKCKSFEALQMAIKALEKQISIDDVIKKLAESEDTILTDKQYYTLMEIKE